jgi:hypothetical protein
MDLGLVRVLYFAHYSITLSATLRLRGQEPNCRDSTRRREPAHHTSLVFLFRASDPNAVRNR